MLLFPSLRSAFFHLAVTLQSFAFFSGLDPPYLQPHCGVLGLSPGTTSLLCMLNLLMISASAEYLNLASDLAFPFTLSPLLP